MRKLTICLMLLCCCVGWAQDEMPIFERIFHNIYRGWDEMGGRAAMVFEPTGVRVRFITSFRLDPDGGAVRDLTMNFPVPPNTPHQTVLNLWPSHENHTLVDIGQGQEAMVVKYARVEPGQRVAAGWDAEVEVSKIIHPIKILAQCTNEREIPSDCREIYTQDDEAYLITSPVMRQAAAQVMNQAGNYHEAVLGAYELVSNTISYDEGLLVKPRPEDYPVSAPAALERGGGTCHHYALCMVALCRAMGIPARYCCGAVMGREILHAWPEVYYPEWGWVSFDPTWGKSGPSRRASHFGTLESTCITLTTGLPASREARGVSYIEDDADKPPSLHNEMGNLWGNQG